jgi:hypothetical protein
MTAPASSASTAADAQGGATTTTPAAGTPAAATTTTTTTTTAAATASEVRRLPLPQKQKPRLLVIDIADRGAGSDVVNAVNQAIQGQAVTSHAGETVTSTQIKILMNASAAQQLVGCDTELCMTDIGQLVEADVILGGNVVRVGSDVLMTLMTVDPASGRRLQQVQRKVPLSREFFYYAARQLTSLLLTGKPADPRVPVAIAATDRSGGAAEVRVIVDGRQVATASTHQLELDPGQHEVILQRDGFIDWKTTIDVAEATPLQVSAQLVEARVTLWPVALATGIGAVAAGVAALVMADNARDQYDGSGFFGWGETQKDGTLREYEASTSYVGVTPANSADLCRRELSISFLTGRAANPGEEAFAVNDCGVANGPGLVHYAAGLAGLLAVATGTLITADLIAGAQGE